jgi:hypothetical protein
VPVRSDRRFVKVDSDIVLRACAISAVVWNHADLGSRGTLGGGMTVLMMLSGFMFARFSLADHSAVKVRQSLVSLGLHILLPSLGFVVFYAFALRQFDPLELLFISNWWTTKRVALFPTWYPQVMVQMFILLYLLFLTPLGRLAERRPLHFSLGVFLVGVAVRFAFPIWVWDSEPLVHHLPHLFLWNFSLGWVVYFLAERGGRTLPRLLLAWACIVLGGLVGWGAATNDFLWLVTAGALFLMIPRLTLPRIVAIPVGIVSQATFAIFLLHRGVYVVMEHFCPGTDYVPLARWSAAMLFCLSTWIGYTAVTRAWRVLHQQNRPVTT